MVVVLPCFWHTSCRAEDRQQHTAVAEVSRQPGSFCVSYGSRVLKRAAVIAASSMLNAFIVIG
jgi:hypothetical protein